MKIIAIVAFLAFAAVLPSCRSVPAEALPETQIWLADFDIRTGEVSNAAMVIDAPGYDNQPMFTADSKALLFVSDRDGGGLTDVYRYDLETSSISRLTSTPEQEFSPTPIPGTTDFSVVRVGRPNDTGSAYTESQQLWRYRADGTPLSPVIPNNRIGYHAWMDSSWVAAFVVGNESIDQPHRLEIIGTDSAIVFPVASNIGRCIRRHPSGQLTYVDKSDSMRNVLMITTGPDTPNQVLVTMPTGAEDYCWLWDTSVLFLSKDGTISRWIKGTELGIQQLTSLYLQGQGARITANAASTKIAWVVVKPRSQQ